MANLSRMPSPTVRGAIVVVILALAVAVAVGPSLNLTPVDFGRFYKASETILARQNPYGRIPFFAPPWIAFMLSPLLLLPLPSAALAWTLLNIAALVVSACTLWALAAAPEKRGRFLLAGLAAILPYALFNYVSGQLSVVSLMACALCAWGLSADRPWAIVVGLTLTTLKPHIVALPALVVILELVRRRHWLWILQAVAAPVGLGLIALAFVPTWPRELLAAWLGGGFRDQPVFDLQTFNIPGWTTYPFVAYTLFVWWRRRCDAYVLAVATVANILATPYSRSYDYVLLLIPLIVAWAAPPSSRQRLALGLTTLAQFLPLVRACAPHAGPLEVIAPALCMLGLLLTSFRSGEADPGHRAGQQVRERPPAQTASQ